MAEKSAPEDNYFIPVNFGSGVNLMGFNFQIRNMIEGIVLAIAFTLIGWKVMSFVDALAQRAGLTFIFTIIGFFVGNNGYKGDPFSTALINIIKFQKTKRICYYNNRAKVEAKPKNINQAVTDEVQIFGRKQAQELLAKINTKATTFVEDERPDDLFFEEDRGIVAMPSNYIGAKKEAKERRKNEERKNKRKAKEKGKD